MKNMESLFLSNVSFNKNLIVRSSPICKYDRQSSALIFIYSKASTAISQNDYVRKKEEDEKSKFFFKKKVLQTIEEKGKIFLLNYIYENLSIYYSIKEEIENNISGNKRIFIGTLKEKNEITTSYIEDIDETKTFREVSTKNFDTKSINEIHSTIVINNYLKSVSYDFIKNKFTKKIDIDNNKFETKPVISLPTPPVIDVVSKKPIELSSIRWTIYVNINKDLKNLIIKKASEYKLSIANFIEEILLKEKETNFQSVYKPEKILLSPFYYLNAKSDKYAPIENIEKINVWCKHDVVNDISIQDYISKEDAVLNYSNEDIIQGFELKERKCNLKEKIKIYLKDHQIKNVEDYPTFDFIQYITLSDILDMQFIICYENGLYKKTDIVEQVSVHYNININQILELIKSQEKIILNGKYVQFKELSKKHYQKKEIIELYVNIILDRLFENRELFDNNTFTYSRISDRDVDTNSNNLNSETTKFIAINADKERIAPSAFIEKVCRFYEIESAKKNADAKPQMPNDKLSGKAKRYIPKNITLVLPHLKVLEENKIVLTVVSETIKKSIKKINKKIKIYNQQPTYYRKKIIENLSKSIAQDISDYIVKEHNKKDNLFQKPKKNIRLAQTIFPKIKENNSIEDINKLVGNLPTPPPPPPNYNSLKMETIKRDYNELDYVPVIERVQEPKYLYDDTNEKNEISKTNADAEVDNQANKQSDKKDEKKKNNFFSKTFNFIKKIYHTS